MISIDARYQGEKHVQLTHGPSQAVIETDAPKDNNGRGESFSPTDLVAAALASCAMTVMAIRAEKIGLELKGMKSNVTKEMVENPRRIARLKLAIAVPVDVSKMVSSENRTLLEQIAHSCPVAQSLSSGMELKISVLWE